MVYVCVQCFCFGQCQYDGIDGGEKMLVVMIEEVLGLQGIESLEDLWLLGDVYGIDYCQYFELQVDDWIKYFVNCCGVIVLNYEQVYEDVCGDW